MKNVNSKGFLLVETVIVSVFVLTIFLLVFRNSLPIVSVYKNRQKYDDIDSVYNVNLFKELIERDGFIRKAILDQVDTLGYVDITDCGVFTSNKELYDTCNNLKIATKIESENKMYVTHWDLSVEGTNGSLLKNSSINRGLLEYLKFLNEQGEREKEYSYRLILSRTVYSNYEQVVVGDEGSVSSKRKSSVYYANIGL